MNANNSNSPAFPNIWSDEHGIIDAKHPGFSKHEYAAILIAAQLAGSGNTTFASHKEIANMAYSLAAEVLNKFK